MALYPCQCILTILSTPLELLEMEVDLLRQLDNVAVGFLELITLTPRKPPRLSVNSLTPGEALKGTTGKPRALSLIVK